MIAKLVDAFLKNVRSGENVDRQLIGHCLSDDAGVQNAKPDMLARRYDWLSWSCLLPAVVACILCGNAWFSLATEPERNLLNLAKALALTLEKSPVLSSFSWDMRAAEARIIQAKLVPNPEISVEGEDFTRGWCGLGH